MAEELKSKYGNGLVVITGATNGLGPFYANYFATLGFTNILLIAKESEKLSEVKSKLKEKVSNKQSINIFTFATDLDTVELNSQSKAELESYIKRVTDKTDKHVSILVNNIAEPRTVFDELKPV